MMKLKFWYAVFPPKRERPKPPNALVADLATDRLGKEYLEQGDNGLKPGRRRRYGREMCFFARRLFDNKLEPFKPIVGRVPPEWVFYALGDPDSPALYDTADVFWTPARIKGLFIMLGVGLFILFLVYAIARG
jgi:hypothetical protein